MLKGVLEGCILQIISYEEIYKSQITRGLNELGFLDIVDGFVYTIFVRKDKKEWRAHASHVESLPKYYKIVYKVIQKYLYKVGPPKLAESIKSCHIKLLY